MTKNKEIGKTAVILAVVAYVAMTAVSFISRPPERVSGEVGLCLPSPNLWEINPVSSWLINTVLIGAVAMWGYMLNRTFNFIRSTKPVLPVVFLILASSNPWITYYLSSSTIICVVNLLCLNFLFGEYNSRNATQTMFVIGTFLSVGSMFQYAFLPMIVAYGLAAMVMKIFRVKELLALGMGLVAPYWVCLGTGLISVDSFRIPELTNLFNDFAQASEIFVLALSVGFLAFIGFFLALNNSVRLYAGNSRVNALNMTVTILEFVCVICMVVDFSNMLAYLGTLYFTVAVQIANVCALWHLKRDWPVAVTCIIYIGFFIAMLIGTADLV